MTESAVMIALGAILGLIKLVELPYGGSVTIASMLPVLIIAYRYGTLWGLFTGLVHGVLQFVMGSSVLSYVSGAASVAAVIVFDYILAFALVGLGGLFRKIKSPTLSLTLGAVIAGVARYICHVISGATVWAGLSVPTAGALVYSFSYNATYMIPETLVLALAAYYIGGLVDFRAPHIAPIKERKEKGPRLSPVSLVFSLGALCYDVIEVFSHLQNGESGEFDITGIKNVPWTNVFAVTAAGIILTVAVCLIINSIKRKKAAHS